MSNVLSPTSRLEQFADPLPVAPILSRRDSEASTDGVEVDADEASSPPPPVGDVGLLDHHRAS